MMIAIFNIVVWLFILSLSGSPTQWIRWRWKRQRQTVNTSEWLSYRGLAAVVHYVHKRQTLCICVCQHLFSFFFVKRKHFIRSHLFHHNERIETMMSTGYIHRTINLLTILIETCTEIRENLNNYTQKKIVYLLTTVTERKKRKEQIIRHWNVLSFIFTPIWIWWWQTVSLQTIIYILN